MYLQTFEQGVNVWEFNHSLLRGNGVFQVFAETKRIIEPSKVLSTPQRFLTTRKPSAFNLVWNIDFQAQDTFNVGNKSFAITRLCAECLNCRIQAINLNCRKNTCFNMLRGYEIRETSTKKCYPLSWNDKREEQIMLKLEENCSIAAQSFEDFILVILVLIDDFYKKSRSERGKISP